MILFNAISSFTDNAPNKVFNKRRSGNLNSLSHELQIKKSNKEESQEQNDKNINDNKNKKKIFKPMIISKSKNHDKKIHINKNQKHK